MTSSYFFLLHVDDLSYSIFVLGELAKAETIMWRVHQVEFILLTNDGIVCYHTYIPKDADCLHHPLWLVAKYWWLLI